MLEIKITTSGMIGRGGTQRWRQVMAIFREAVGDALVLAVQEGLGQASLYTLSPNYSKDKIEGKTRPIMQHVPGKAADQPIILTREGIYDALQCVDREDGVVVRVDPTEGINPDDGFDYAEHWQEVTHYLDLGLAKVEPQMAAMMEDAIIRGMLL